MTSTNFRLSRTARRGVALLLVTIAVMVSSIIAYTYLAAQETSIGIARNIRNHAKARYVAESGLDLAMAAIKANSNWRTTYTSGTNWITDIALLGGTVTVKGEDGQDKDGDGVISNPTEGDGNLADDATDLVTLTITGKFSGATHVLRAVVTPMPGNTIIVYGEQNDSYIYYRTRSGSSWTNQQSSGQNVGSNPKWYVARCCPRRSEVAVGTLNSGNDLYLQFWNGSAWGAANMLLTGNAGINSERPYDLVYEQLTGDLLFAYRDATGPSLHYRTATSSSSISGDLTYALPTTGNLRWVKLVSKASSNEITLITLSGSKDIATAIWNGSAWGNSIVLESNAKSAGNEEITAVYEGMSGRAMVAWSEAGQTTFLYRTWNGSSWSSQSNGPTLPAEPQWLKLAADPMSNNMVMASLDSQGNIILSSWNGSAWGSSPLTVETDASATDRRPFDVIYEKSSGKAIAVWGRANQNNFFYRTWSGSAWSSEVAGPGMANKVSFAQLVNDGSQNQIYLSILNKNTGSLQSLIWNGSSFSSPATLDSDLSGPNSTESYMVASTPSTGSGGSTSYKVDQR